MSGWSRLQKVALFIALLFLISAVAVIGINAFFGDDIGLRTENNSNNSSKKSTNVDLEKTEALQGVTSISIAAVSENIRLITADTGDVKARLYGSYYSINPDIRPELTVEKAGGRIDIQVTVKPDSAAIFYSSALKLDITLPKEFTGELEVKTTSGNLTADVLNLKDFIFKTVSGDLSAQRIDAKTSAIATTSGDVKFNGIFDSFLWSSVSGDLRSGDFVSGTTDLKTTSGDSRLLGNPGDVSFDSVSGDITLTYDLPTKKVKAATTSGDISINLPENTGFTLDYKTVTGTFECAFPLYLSGAKRDKGVKGVVGNGTGTIEVTSVSGDLRIVK